MFPRGADLGQNEKDVGIHEVKSKCAINLFCLKAFWCENSDESFVTVKL